MNNIELKDNVEWLMSVVKKQQDQNIDVNVLAQLAKTVDEHSLWLIGYSEIQRQYEASIPELFKHIWPLRGRDLAGDVQPYDIVIAEQLKKLQLSVWNTWPEINVETSIQQWVVEQDLAIVKSVFGDNTLSSAYASLFDAIFEKDDPLLEHGTALSRYMKDYFQEAEEERQEINSRLIGVAGNQVLFKQSVFGNHVVDQDYVLYEDLRDTKIDLTSINNNVEIVGQKTQEALDGVTNLQGSVKTLQDNERRFYTISQHSLFTNYTCHVSDDPVTKLRFDNGAANLVVVYLAFEQGGGYDIIGHSFYKRYALPILGKKNDTYNDEREKPNVFTITWYTNPLFKNMTVARLPDGNLRFAFQIAHGFQTWWDNGMDIDITVASKKLLQEGYSIYVVDGKVTGREKGIISSEPLANKRTIDQSVYNQIDLIHPVIVEGKKIYKLLPIKDYSHWKKPYVMYEHHEKDKGIVSFKAQVPKKWYHLKAPKEEKTYTDNIKFERKFLGYIF